MENSLSIRFYVSTEKLAEIIAKEFSDPKTTGISFEGTYLNRDQYGYFFETSQLTKEPPVVASGFGIVRVSLRDIFPNNPRRVLSEYEGRSAWGILKKSGEYSYVVILEGQVYEDVRDLYLGTRNGNIAAVHGKSWDNQQVAETGKELTFLQKLFGA